LLSFGVVDLYIRVMTHPAAKGERFLVFAGDCLSMLDIAKLLKVRMGASAKKCQPGNCPIGWCAPSRCLTQH
jgi:dihydroflavonol-4-reductase